MTEVRGWHVLFVFVASFVVIIGVNLTLAYNAIATFPGVEVRNSYIASQSFDKNRTAQLALGWDVSAELDDEVLSLTFQSDGQPFAPTILEATFGRATNVEFDQQPEFTFDGTAFRAPVVAGNGNWNLRVKAQAADGTVFQQRIVVRTHS